jgi:predicted ArsR family transcriptional regulator
MKKVPQSIVKRHPDESVREGLLRVLKLRGEASIVDLCKAVGVTHSAVRRQLSSLQKAGLIVCRLHQESVGRPSYIYRLSEAASDHFPSGYENMSAYLLDTIFSQSGHPGVMELLRLNNNRLFETLWPRFADKKLAQRVEELAAYFTDNGYMSGWKALPDGNFFLYHQNCAIYKLAVRYRQLCIVEPRLMEGLLGVKVTRQQYILKDQPICGYLVDSTRPLFSQSS